LVYIKLLEDELVLALPPDHTWVNKSVVALEELLGQPMILREVGSGSRKVFEDALTSARLDSKALTVVAELGSTEAIRQAVKSGAGISVISLRAIQEDLARGALCTVPLEGIRLTRDFYLVYHKNRSRSPVCENFATFLIESLSPKPAPGS
jgi:DNA-binding transcriptional LysR family regulator